MLIFSFLFFIITILPVSNLIPVRNNSLLFDRFTYLAHAGIMFLISWFLYNIYEGKILRSKNLKSATFIIGFSVIVILSYLSYQSRLNNDIALWSDMVENIRDEAKVILFREYYLRQRNLILPYHYNSYKYRFNKCQLF
jgi:hypothetical protein